MAKKRIHTYKVVITTVGGNTITADDGSYVSCGYDAYKNLINHETVVVRGAGTTVGTFIPFESIDNAVVTMESTTDEYEDANCVVTSESE